MIEDYYNTTVTVVTIANVNDWATAAAAESCATEIVALNPIRGSEQRAAGEEWPFADYKMFCSSTVDVDEQDEVRQGTNKYNVVFVKNTLAMNHHKTVYLRRNHA